MQAEAAIVLAWTAFLLDANFIQFIYGLSATTLEFICGSD